jgi:predicted DNA-binding transcriptional regulator AlpA
MNALHEVQEQELDRRIERKLRGLGLLMPDVWMTSTQAAAHARMSKWHFQRLCRQGRGPDRVGTGKLMRFRRSAVDCWLDGQAAHSN